VRRLLGRLPALLLVALAAWVVLFVAMSPTLPDTAELFADSAEARVTVLASDGVPIAVRGGRGSFVPLSEISPWLVDAVVATEDRRFFSHVGIDPVGLGRAMLDNLNAGAVVAGGSTITQQLAKNLYLTPERSLTRKLQELTLALWLEVRLSKKEILTLYLNRAYLGAGAYGAEAASRRYFGKPAAELTLAEAAMLAGLLKAPSALAPTGNLAGARQRAAVVLGRMQAEGFITPAQAQAARAKPAKLAPETEPVGAWFVDWVLDGLTGHLGKPERDLVVRTTLDRRVQRAAEAAVERTLAETAARNQVGEAAVVMLDTNGAVRAMVGGRDHAEGPFNRAVAARRQPGSAFKPFVYVTALEAGWRPGNTIDDRPVQLAGWRPENMDRRYRGQITLTEAFADSVNTAAVRLAQTVGPARVAAKAREMGVVSAVQPVPSIALGTSEVGLLELTGAYLPFATGGIRRPVYGVTSVEDDRGEVLYRHMPTEVRVVAPEAAAGMQQLMAAVVADGTGRAARLPDRVAAGKTGTSQDGRDAWFVGYAGNWVAGVWLGNDDNRPMKGVGGGGLPARIWHDAMLATPKPKGPPPAPARKPEPESGLDWLIDLVTGTVGGATN
jgi:penicillin-binding protein 1A